MSPLKSQVHSGLHVRTGHAVVRDHVDAVDIGNRVQLASIKHADNQTDVSSTRSFPIGLSKCKTEKSGNSSEETNNQVFVSPIILP